MSGGLRIVEAEEFPLPSQGEDLVGESRETRVASEDTLLDIGRRFDLGNDQIVKANPRLDQWVPGVGSLVQIPSHYILPDTDRKGLVLSLAELRLYYYSPQDQKVMTFPMSIGRIDWKTPLGKTTVVKKDRDPVWVPTESIRQEHAAEGEELPDSIAGGVQDNPLGKFALRLGVPGYLIHGTDEAKSFGIGMQVTHGCVRMYPEDIERLFPLVPVGTIVQILNKQAKVGWSADQLFLQVDRPLDAEEQEVDSRISLTEVIQMVEKKANGTAELDLEAVRKAYELGNGVPAVIGRKH